MYKLNAAARLAADAKQIEQDIATGLYRIVDFPDKPYQVVHFKTGRFGVVHRDAEGKHIKDDDMEEKDAMRLAEHANKTGRWNPKV